MNGNIYLVGFMGSGKTTVGNRLARALNRHFVDMDEILEKRFGKPIREVFIESGEPAFRAKESALLEKISKQERRVVATGGGVPEREANRKLMKATGVVVHLDADLRASQRRLGASQRAARPLWTEKSSVQTLFERRKSLYADCDFSVQANGNRPERVTEAILQGLIPEDRFVAKLGSSKCPIVATVNAPEVIADVVKERKTALVTDRTVLRLHGQRYRSLLERSVVVTVSPGEKSKTLANSRRIYEALIANEFDRDDLLIALGGGVVTDLAAFAASTYKRGMDFVLVSTTLVGCVDAAIGGKAAVNVGSVKNVVGSFSTPRAVVLDIAALRTLGPRQRSEGLVEAYKTGLVASPELTELVEQHAFALMKGDLALLARVAQLSARAKADVVSSDFRESGLRRILNFGHTFGHAVESHHHFRVSHGRAVALGMRVAAEISEGRGLISSDVVARINSTLDVIAPYEVAMPPLDEAWKIMQQDKKIRRGKIVFALLEELGRATCVEDLSKAELAAAIRRVKESQIG
ncbi:MAG: 3-dehydroquinate synthase [Thermodesulfobacteriota bacterium]